MKNQEVHKNLRRNKPGVRLSDIGEPPLDYIRPEGFNMVQSILHYRSGTQPDEEDSVKYYRDLKEEMSRYIYICKSKEASFLLLRLSVANESEIYTFNFRMLLALASQVVRNSKTTKLAGTYR